MRDIQTKTEELQIKVSQLKMGLNDTSVRLSKALKKCASSKVCAQFLEEYNIAEDLAVATNFRDLPTRLPDLSLLMRDISDLMENDIEEKVKGGQKQLDKVKVDIEESIGDIRPEIKRKLRRMGKQLEYQAAEIQRYLDEMDAHLGTVRKDVPDIEPVLEKNGEFHFFIGLGMSFMVLILLLCHIFGLFYGFCGKRPGNIYGDDCCNTGTGSNWLLAAIYLTFLFSFVLLVVSTGQFLTGSAVDKVVCESLRHPKDSELFQILDERFVQPIFERSKTKSQISLTEFIHNCHQNMTLYRILQVEHIYNVEDLRNWKTEFGIGNVVDDLKRKIRLDDLQNIQILSPEAERELRELAESQISDLNFSQYTELLKEKITSIDLVTFTVRLRRIKEELSGSQLRLVGAAIENEAMFIENMQKVVMDMKMAIRDLDKSVKLLEKEARHTKPSLGEAIRELINQATKATAYLRKEGPELVDQLTDLYVNETVGLVDNYVERVINRTENQVGNCRPISNSYNATVISVCNEIVDPYNGIWASVGWCLMFFIPSIALAVSLVSLYRKSEPYPGPLVEAVPVEEPVSQHNKKKRRGHRRNPSEYLPDSAHYRAGYSYQNPRNSESRFQDVAPRNSVQQPVQGAAAPESSGGPPRYSSNPNLDNPEYERPPPYYFPGSDAPPPLPAPNRN